MTFDIIQSAWWIVYYLVDNEPRYLLIKRQARSKKIERVAPKWKVQTWETLERAAVREVSEETWLPYNSLHLWKKVWVMQLRNEEKKENMMDKDMTFYLMRYTWEPDNVSIIDWEGYIGMYKWMTIEEVLQLVYYTDMREIIRKAHKIVLTDKKNTNIKKDFLENI